MTEGEGPYLASRCACCGGGLIQLLDGTHPDKDGKRVRLTRCEECSAIAGVYTPAEDPLGAQIRHHEALWAAETEESLLQARDDMDRMIDFHRRHLPDPSSEHCLLDIGSGRGNLLAALRRRGYSALGCEPSLAMAQRARATYQLGNSVLANCTADLFLRRVRRKAITVDAVFLWHVLEHLPEPMSLLRRLKRLLRPGGALICQGPMLSEGNLFPEHRFLHTEPNIRWMAAQAGFELGFIDCRPSVLNFASFVLKLPAR